MEAQRISREREIARIASRQHGALTHRQLLGLGVDKSTVSRWVGRGRLHRIHRGVYLVGHTAVSDRGRWMSAVLVAGDGAALSRHAAAALWGIHRGRFHHIDVVSPNQHRPSAEVAFHRSSCLDPRDFTIVDGIPVTTVARTIVDLGDVMTPAQLARVMHEAAYLQLLDVNDVRAALQRVRGRRRTWCVTAALAMHSEGSVGTRSGLEDRMLAAVASWPVPRPRINVRVQLEDCSYELDMWWPNHGVCVEVDGPGHQRPQVQLADAARDAALAAVGIIVIRVTAEDLRRRRRHIRRRLESALAREWAGVG